jgi:hypothetical protein
VETPPNLSPESGGTAKTHFHYPAIKSET